MQRTPPRFRPGPLTYETVAALNQMAQDFYGSVFGRFHGAPPLTCKHDATGVAYGLNANALATAPVNNVTLTYTSDTINYVGCTINFTSTTVITVDATSSLIINGELDLNTSPCWKRVARQITTSTVNDWSLSTEPWWVIDYNPGGGTCILYGIVAPTCARDIWITNTGKDSGTNNTILQFRHEDATETTAARRFLTPDAQPFDLYPQQTALLRYDMTTARWRLFVVPLFLTTKGDLLSFGTGLARLAVGSDGQVLTADSSQATGLTWKSLVNSGVPIAKLYTINYNDAGLNVSSTTATITIATLALGEVLQSVFMYQSTAFVGSMTTLTAKLKQTAGDLTATRDIKAAPSDPPTPVSGSQLPSLLVLSGDVLQVVFAATIANLNTLSAGVLKILVLTWKA